MSTIIKTGCNLWMFPGGFDPFDSNLPPFARYKDGSCAVHGDLHFVDSAFILYMSEEQAPVWKRCHGIINFGYEYFFRRNPNGFHPLVIPVAAVGLWQEDIHYSYHQKLNKGNVVWINSETYFPVPKKPVFILPDKPAPAQDEGDTFA